MPSAASVACTVNVSAEGAVAPVPGVEHSHVGGIDRSTKLVHVARVARAGARALVDVGAVGIVRRQKYPPGNARKRARQSVQKLASKACPSRTRQRHASSSPRSRSARAVIEERRRRGAREAAATVVGARDAARVARRHDDGESPRPAGQTAGRPGGGGRLRWARRVHDAYASHVHTTRRSAIRAVGAAGNVPAGNHRCAPRVPPRRHAGGTILGAAAQHVPRRVPPRNRAASCVPTVGARRRQAPSW